MRLRDIAVMALHNLWSRKMRTALNLTGVVISCVMLVMTFAGTRGAGDGIQAIINRSDEARRFVVRSSYGENVEVPESELVVEGVMTDERRKRIREMKRQEYIRDHFTRAMIGRDDLARLRKIEHVVSIVPDTLVSCEIKLGDASAGGFTGAIKPDDRRLQERIIAGSMLNETDENTIAIESHQGLINEYTAYQLGYRSDSELEELIGKDLTVEHRIGSAGVGRFLERLARRTDDGNLLKQAELAVAVQKLLHDLDSTSLSDNEKQLLRESFEKVVGITPPKDDTEAETESEHEKHRVVKSDDPRIRINDKGEVVLAGTFKVRGIVRLGGDQDIFSFLNVVHGNFDRSLLVNYRLAEELNSEDSQFTGYWSATGEVDDLRQLRNVIEEIEESGLQTSSALHIFERIDREIGKARMVISAIALFILFIAAIGISNTMIIAVLERTPEFGIMKALGARDAHVLWLMILEGGLTGLVGAIVAVIVSLGVSWGVGILVRNHIQARIGEAYQEQVFIYSPLDLLIVFLVAVVVCTIAGILPAWRAARLDPIVAMRRS